MNRDEAEKKIRQAAEEGNVEFAPTDGVDSFDFADEFLEECVGVSGAWISDMSGLSDFGAHHQETYARIEAKYGVDVRGMDNLLEIFRVIAAVPKSIQ